MADKEKDREVPYSEAKTYADTQGMQYIEVSSKTGYNMQKLLEMITNFACNTILYKLTSVDED
jgi:hypothetical protein